MEYEISVEQAHAQVSEWRYSMKLQVDRLDGAPAGRPGFAQRQADMKLFVLAAREFRRAAQFVADTAGPGDARNSILAALAVFDEQAPHLIDMRDIHTHFDEYATGAGNLQKAADKQAAQTGSPPRPSQFNTFYQGGDTYMIHVMIKVGGERYSVDIQKTDAAADQLADRIAEVVA